MEEYHLYFMLALLAANPVPIKAFPGGTPGSENPEKKEDPNQGGDKEQNINPQPLQDAVLPGSSAASQDSVGLIDKEDPNQGGGKEQNINPQPLQDAVLPGSSAASQDPIDSYMIKKNLDQVFSQKGCDQKHPFLGSECLLADSFHYSLYRCSFIEKDGMKVAGLLNPSQIDLDYKKFDNKRILYHCFLSNSLISLKQNKNELGQRQIHLSIKNSSLSIPPFESFSLCTGEAPSTFSIQYSINNNACLHGTSPIISEEEAQASALLNKRFDQNDAEKIVHNMDLIYAHYLNQDSKNNNPAEQNTHPEQLKNLEKICDFKNFGIFGLHSEEKIKELFRKFLQLLKTCTSENQVFTFPGKSKELSELIIEVAEKKVTVDQVLEKLENISNNSEVYGKFSEKYKKFLENWGLLKNKNKQFRSLSDRICISFIAAHVNLDKIKILNKEEIQKKKKKYNDTISEGQKLYLAFSQDLSNFIQKLEEDPILPWIVFLSFTNYQFGNFNQAQKGKISRLFGLGMDTDSYQILKKFQTSFSKEFLNLLKTEKELLYPIRKSRFMLQEIKNLEENN